MYSFRDHTPRPATYLHRHDGPGRKKPYRCTFRLLMADNALTLKQIREIRQKRAEAHLAVHLKQRRDFYTFLERMLNANRD